MKKNKMTDHILLRSDRCIACGSCVETCPTKVLGMLRILWHQHAKVCNAAACIGCLKCVNVCPQQAIIVPRDLNIGNLPPGVPARVKCPKGAT